MDSLKNLVSDMKKNFLLLSALVAGLFAQVASQGAEWIVDWKEDFSNTNILKNWTGGGGEILLNQEKGNALYLKQMDGKGTVAQNLVLPKELYTVGELDCRAWVKWRNVSEKPQPWNGVKYMLKIDTVSGTVWPQGSIPIGSSDWTPIRFFAQMPAGTTNVTLHLGLEQVSGEAWFSDIQIKKYACNTYSDSLLKQPVMAKTHSQERLRGAMVAPGSITLEDLDVLKSWGANLLRWQLIYTGKSPTDEEYDNWLNASLDKLDKFLPEIVQRDMVIALDLHSPPGCGLGGNGYVTSAGGVWAEQRYQDKFVQIWEAMAKRYKGVPGIWGFDLMNEPVDDDTSSEVNRWHSPESPTGGSLALRTALAVRAIDPDRTLIIEPNHWGGVEAMAFFKPLPLENVVYSPHMYRPHQFTHQGVGQNKVGVEYPGKIGDEYWDKDMLREALQATRDFQLRYNVPIYIGEFSAIRWAPNQGAYRYLSDLISIFEEYGWDWSYHAFREWSGWSVEHSDDPEDNERMSSPPKRQQLLMKYFKKNTE